LFGPEEGTVNNRERITLPNPFRLSLGIWSATEGCMDRSSCLVWSDLAGMQAGSNRFANSLTVLRILNPSLPVSRVKLCDEVNGRADTPTSFLSHCVACSPSFLPFSFLLFLPSTVRSGSDGSPFLEVTVKGRWEGTEGDEKDSWRGRATGGVLGSARRSEEKVVETELRCLGRSFAHLRCDAT